MSVLSGRSKFEDTKVYGESFFSLSRESCIEGVSDRIDRVTAFRKYQLN